MAKTLSMEDAQNIALSWNPHQFDMVDRVLHFGRFGIQVPDAAKSVLMEIINLENAEIPPLSVAPQTVARPTPLPQDTRRAPADSENCESDSVVEHQDVKNGLREEILKGMEQVESSIYSMNAVINRILVEMRKNRVTKKELPGDVAEMGGIRDDWVVKKRRLITRSKASWIESERVGEVCSDGKRPVSEASHSVDHSFIDYEINDDNPVSKNPAILLSDSDEVQDEIQITTFAEITPPSTVHKLRQQPDKLPGHDLIDVEIRRLYEEAFGESVQGSTAETSVQPNSSTSPMVFNEETRSQVLTRLRAKYGSGEFNRGIARSALFNGSNRPTVVQWAEFIDRCLSDNIIAERQNLGRYKYRFI